MVTALHDRPLPSLLVSLGRSWVSGRHSICVIDDRTGYMRRHAGLMLSMPPRSELAKEALVP